MNDSNSLILFSLGVFTALLTIMNPLLALPVFLALTEKQTKTVKRVIARRTTMAVFLILLIFFVMGKVILAFFGISYHALKIGGGLMILLSAYDLLRNKNENKANENSTPYEQDISVFPLAMPLISGPGAIAVMVGMTSRVHSVGQWFVVLGVILVLSLICYGVLRMADWFMAFLGSQFFSIMGRFMGFILLCLGVQFIAHGTQGLFVETFSQIGLNTSLVTDLLI